MYTIPLRNVNCPYFFPILIKLGKENVSNGKCTFSTCNFSIDDCQILIAGLKKLNINSDIKIYDNYPYICLNTDNSERLFLLVAPYVPPCMQRKLPPRYQNHLGWLPTSSNSFKPFVVEQQITQVSQYTSRNTYREYKINTDIGNCFANGLLIQT